VLAHKRLCTYVGLNTCWFMRAYECV
jgi:hypothetical protein